MISVIPSGSFKKAYLFIDILQNIRLAQQREKDAIDAPPQLLGFGLIPCSCKMSLASSREEIWPSSMSSCLLMADRAWSFWFLGVVILLTGMV